MSAPYDANSQEYDKIEEKHEDMRSRRQDKTITMLFSILKGKRGGAKSPEQEPTLSTMLKGKRGGAKSPEQEPTFAPMLKGKRGGAKSPEQEPTFAPM
ncbi:hypothetical protein GUITHDRAFT_108040 [Guillardia theta CCMP2712]|uniref:Uncharacterized protein n=1 Tax=Guillardia theta (strain CCMP2712) TaxID=905079 RepID=L1JD03_GUITC|nr:hypothetical protein GUITHDRAFT_108040 [Guillardia theta CCMP2712]EKX45999.1 hypothetical protein GUITHDRAFT_108040 [Guillardia theta CCMP2712]|eukprot:XP_005832979.1 hypothetical protein GUITHDRAFT_108040 [Guillardia theta CCMP2712]